MYIIGGWDCKLLRSQGYCKGTILCCYLITWKCQAAEGILANTLVSFFVKQCIKDCISLKNVLATYSTGVGNISCYPNKIRCIMLPKLYLLHMLNTHQWCFVNNRAWSIFSEHRTFTWLNVSINNIYESFFHLQWYR